MTLAPPPTYDRDVVPSSEKFQSRLEPAGYKLAIAVDKLDEADVRIQFDKRSKAFVSCPRRAEGSDNIEVDDLYSQPHCSRSTAVG